MNRTYLFILCVIKIYSTDADYYWRDYDLLIPCDAVQGGTDALGYYTYIGQITAFECGKPGLPDIVSATIYKYDDYAYAAYHGKIFKSNKGVKILCSRKGNKLKWLNSDQENCKLVQGSFTDTYTNFYIGRSRFNNQNVTGRFSLNERVLYVPWKPMPNVLQTFKQYDMLMDCDEEHSLTVSVE
ncbi:hypothetical protein FQR65_LT09169 [Abscondita terminalis]|nr:hypothetical protein FQR65_LT09169 [Abscondita terminalis]